MSNSGDRSASFDAVGDALNRARAKEKSLEGDPDVTRAVEAGKRWEAAQMAATEAAKPYRVALERLVAEHSHGYAADSDTALQIEALNQRINDVQFDAYRRHGFEPEQTDEPEYLEFVESKDDDTEQLPPALTPNEQFVLITLERFDSSKLESVARISEAMAPSQRLSEETVRKIVNRLIELSLAERPEGTRSGVRLTRTGRRSAGKIVH